MNSSFTMMRIRELEIKLQQLTEVVNELKEKDFSSEIEKHIRYIYNKDKLRRRKLSQSSEEQSNSESESNCNFFTEYSPPIQTTSEPELEENPLVDVTMKVEIDLDDDENENVEDVEVYGSEEMEEEQEQIQNHYDNHTDFEAEDVETFGKNEHSITTTHVQVTAVPTVVTLRDPSQPTPDNEEMRTGAGFLAHIERTQGGLDLLTDNFECLHCGRILKSKITLVSHLRAHYPFCPFTCDACPESFKTYGALKLHKQFHTGNLFRCTFCQKTFTNKFNLETHEMVHRGQKDHKCDRCLKDFRTKSHLRRHMRIHTGEKPYSCAVCGKMFSLLENAKVHSRGHDEGSRIIRAVCTKVKSK